MIVFNRASILSSKINFEYLGGFNFANSEEVSVRGYLYDITAMRGIGGAIYSGIEALDLIKVSSADQVEINGFIYSTGYLSSFEVEAGNWTRFTQYTANVKGILPGIYNFPGVKDYSREFSKNIDTSDPSCPSVKLKSSSTISLDPTYEGSYNLDDLEERLNGIGAKPDLNLETSIIAADLNLEAVIFPSGQNFSNSASGASGIDTSMWNVFIERWSDTLNKIYYFSERVESKRCPSPVISGELASGCPDIKIASANFSATISQDGSQSSSYTLKTPKPQVPSPGTESPFLQLSTGCEQAILNSEGGFIDFLVKYGYSSTLGIQVGRGIGEDDEYYTYEASFLNEVGENATGSATGSSGEFIGNPNCFISKSWKSRANDDGSKTATITYRGEVIDQDKREGKQSCGGGYLEVARSDALNLVGVADTPEEEAQNPVGGNPNDCDPNPDNPDPKPTFELFTEIDSLSYSANIDDGSFTASATAISYWKEIKTEDSDDPNNPNNPDEAEDGSFVAYTITRDEEPRTEYNNIVMSDGSVSRVAYKQPSIGVRTVTNHRRYKNANIKNVDYPPFPAEGNGLTTFTVSKVRRKSSNSSSAEITIYY